MTLYLIAHKVRGEPAFDVAEQMKVGSETWWVVPTSGHRAYPYWYAAFSQIDWEMFRINGNAVPPMPEGLPDHYAVAIKAPKAKATLDFIDLEELGL